MDKKYFAELMGTFCLVLGGCGNDGVRDRSYIWLPPQSGSYDWAVSQLWLFWVAPIVGAILAGLISKRLNDD